MRKQKKVVFSTILLLLVESTWFGTISRLLSVAGAKLAPLQMEQNNKYVIFEKALSIINLSEWIVAAALFAVYVIYIISLRRSNE